MRRIVHHLANSRSPRLLWLLEEMGLPYEVQALRARPARRCAPRPSCARSIRSAASPLLDEDGTIFVESAAIIEHLVDERPASSARPPGADGERRFHMFLHYAEGSLMPPLLSLLVVGRLGLLGRPARKPLLAMFADHLALARQRTRRRATGSPATSSAPPT